MQALNLWIVSTAEVGHRSAVSGCAVLNYASAEPVYGPKLTVPFVIIPKNCEGVVFGKSGKVYINYGNNTYQELKDDGSLGEVISSFGIE